MREVLLAFVVTRDGCLVRTLKAFHNNMRCKTRNKTRGLSHGERSEDEQADLHDGSLLLYKILTDWYELLSSWLWMIVERIDDE